MKSIFLLVAASPVAALAFAQSPENSASGSPDIPSATACPEGTIWDGENKICRPLGPRGSHGGAEDGA